MANFKDTSQGVETSQVSDFGQCVRCYFDGVSTAFCEGGGEPAMHEYRLIGTLGKRCAEFLLKHSPAVALSIRFSP